MTKIVVNLIGGPCCGKSTIASELFSRLKKMGIKCELNVEFIKDKIYQEENLIINDQILLFASQLFKIKTKLNKVDIVINDGSLLNNIIYNKENNKELNSLVIAEYFKFNNLDFFLERGTLPFENYGRIHTLDESLKLDQEIKDLYNMCNAKYISIDSRDAVDKIIPIILKNIGENNEMYY